MSLVGIYKDLKRDLNDIEKQLELTIAADHPVLYKAAFDLLKAGGKRIRPVLVLLSSQYGDKKSPSVHKTAVTLELIHMASLVHDDVIDNAELRRGKKTVKAKWDNRVAMYTGDFIFARAVDLMTDFEGAEAHQLLSAGVMEMSLGEIEQIKDQYNWQQNLRRYLLRIKRKTALLMALSCQLGAVTSGAPANVGKRLYYFGYFMGMSYQITDDILDFVSTEKQLGKPAGSDLKQGNITLPTLYALKQPEMRDRIVQVLESDLATDDDWQEVISLIKNSKAISLSQELSERYLMKAYQVLKDLPDHAATRSFRQIADYIGKRKY
ncbi:heptaprenyl diphosphate synthase [Scopulibacillus darangshiensis]|uniref:Heptaprenyl diphosphate synthase component 2 n=1 Tax=Scopulibacillus darangshiensis TaxID=442528 RepID=A0A4V2SNM0_9BACL|nr:heptaprenyl diphosphate synthase component II [Scopulibacillus darangshiensis]TCP31646.1 heptaprenyl diphosphate synthase [Scopulibacillus darangshiensis]